MRAQDHLRLLQLEHLVSVTDGMFSTTALSRGQRKRLALLTAYLEDRPIYVFDEWAADQDPVFRRFFYLQLLPELKRRGKTVVAITHDDRYFATADRIIKLEEGHVVETLRHEALQEFQFETASTTYAGRTRLKTILCILVAAALVAMSTVRYWRDDFAEPPTFRTQPVARGELFIGVAATGTVEPVQIIDVGAQIVGSVKNFGPDPDHPDKTIDYRSRVTKGAVLAQLDDFPHQAELDKARVNLQLADAELRNFRAKQKQKDRAFKRAAVARDRRRS